MNVGARMISGSHSAAVYVSIRQRDRDELLSSIDVYILLCFACNCGNVYKVMGHHLTFPLTSSYPEPTVVRP